MNNLAEKTNIYSIQDLVRHYQKTRPNGHFFDDETMRFFDSRLSDYLYYIPRKETILFITSEKNPSNFRRYSVREYDTKSGNIAEACLGFFAYKTLAAAKIAALKESLK